MLIISKRGQSILGVILAMAIFALMASAIAGTSVGNLNSLNKGGEQSRAESLAQEAVEAIRGIKENAWNDLYSNSAISFAGYEWSFDSSNVQTIGDYTRTVTFSDVCRDAQNVIVACPGTSVDLQAKKVNVSVSWEIRPGVTNSVNKEFYLTNWDSREWVQTDWSSGPGQSVLSDLAAFYSADDFVDYSTPGEIKIMEMAGGEGCIAKSWDFDNAEEYIYNSTDIEVSASTAHLTFEQSSNIENFGDYIIGSTDNYTNNSSYGSYYRNKLIHISGNIYAMVYNYAYYVNGRYGYIYVRTMEISPSGVVVRPNIRTMNLGYYTSTYGYQNMDVKRVSGNMYVVSAERYYYSGNSPSYLNILSFTVSTDGSTITQNSYNYSFESSAYDPYIEEISPGYFAAVYRYSTTYGRIRTFFVNSTTGAISNIGLYDFDTSIGGYPYIKKTTGNQFLVSYRDSDGTLKLKSLNISSTGVIDTVNVQTYQLDSAAIYSVIINVSGNIYAVAYSNGAGTAGWIQTVSVDPTTGAITEPANNSLQIESTSFANLDFKKITGNSYIVAYRGPDNDGFAKLVSINDEGSVGSVLDTYEFYNADINFPSILQLSNYYFAVNFNNGISRTTYQRDYIYTFSADYGTSYSSANPTIQPTISYTPSGSGSFVGFDEVSTKTNGGEIYYQLSDNNGTDWKYWDGASWSTTTLATDYNTADEISPHIGDFSTSTGPILFKAYFEGNGTQNVSLDRVTLDCKEEFGYDYNNKSEYVYDRWKVDFRDGMAGVKPALTTSSVAWDFNTYSDYYYNSVYIDVSAGKARLIYLGPNDSFNYDYNSSSTYSYDVSKIEFEENTARLKHIGPPLGQITEPVLDTQSYGGIAAYATDILHVRDDIYAYVYNLDNYSSSYPVGNRTAYVVTKRISADGTVISDNLYSYPFVVNSMVQTGSDDFPEIGIAKVSDGVLAVSYSAGSYTYVKTLSVDANGLIAQLAIGTVFYYAGASPLNTGMAKVENTSDIFLVGYINWYSSDDRVEAKAVRISADGLTITILGGASIAVDNGLPWQTYIYRNIRVVYVGPGVMALSYDYSPNISGFSVLVGLYVDGSGNVTLRNSASLDGVLSTSFQNRNVDLIRISDNYLAAVYQDKDKNGWIKTYYINSSGTLTYTPVSSYQYKSSNNGSYPEIISLGNDNYAVLSSKVNDYGTIDIFNISTVGVLNTTPVDSYTYENDDGDSPQIINVGTGIYALAYQTSGSSLIMKTINISSGSIQESFIDSAIVGGGAVKDTKIIQVRDNIFVTGFSSANYSGYGPVTYFHSSRIDADGNIAEPFLNSFSLNIFSLSAVSGAQYDMIKISDGVFAVVYGEQGSSPPSGLVRTYSVDSSGVMTLIESQYLGVSFRTPSIIKLNGSTNVYAISYENSSQSATISTVTIDSNGAIGDAFIDNYTYVYSGVPQGYTGHYHEELLYVRDNIYVLSFDRSETFYYYRYSGSNLISIEIESNGNIITANNSAIGASSLVSDTYVTNSSNFIVNHAVSMEKISASQIAVSYNNSAGTAYLIIYTINSNGSFTSTASMTLASDSNKNYPYIKYLAEKTFAISYSKDGQYILDTYNFTLAGQIVTPKVDTLVFDSSSIAASSYIRNISGDVFAISHNSAGYSAMITTLNMLATPVYATDKPDIISSVQEDFSVDSWDGFTETSDKKGGEIYYQISDNAQTWYYWDNTNWVEATNSSQANIDTVVNANISNFTTSTNSLSVRAFLSSDGSQKVALDNIEVPFTRTITGYASNLPTISSKEAYSKVIPTLYSWRGFSHNVSTTSPGDVYYQISNDDGVTWYYWNGTSWQVATDDEDYNTVSEIDTNIEEFDASTKKIAFKAFMKSDTVQQVELDDVTVTFNIEPADENTLHLWHFDDTGTASFVDSIGSRHIPKYSSATQGEAGKFGYAGKGTYYISNNAQLPKLSNNFTLEMWVKVGSTYSNSYVFVNNMYISNQPSNTGGYSLSSYDGSLSFSLNYGGGVGVGAANVIPANQWTHVAITYDGTYIRMYVNGIYKAATYFVGTIYDNYSNNFYVCGSNNSYTCYLDEMRISNVARWTGTSNFTLSGAPYAGRATYDTSNPSVTVVSSTSYIGSALGSIVETASKNGGEIYYQLSDDEGSTWKYWNGSSWGTAGSSDYNTASIMNEHLSTFATTTGKIAIKAFLSSNGTQNVRLDDIRFLYETATGGGGAGGSGAGSGGGFATSTYFISSAFDLGDNSPVQYLDWDEDLTQCNDCSIRVQVSTAPDNGGVPGTWTPWYGVTGVDTYFVDYFGSIIPNYLNGRRWVRYRVELLGDGTSTPVFKEMRVNYK